MKRDVVITGIGLAAPLGIEPTSFFDALVSGQNGIRRHPDPTIERHVGYVDLDIGAQSRPRVAIGSVCRPTGRGKQWPSR